MDVKTKYDTLASYESLKYKKEISYAIHKQLDFTKLKSGQIPYDDINDWLAANFPLKEGQRLLDAGCGTGKTLFHFLSRYKILATGISKSDVEIRLAMSASKALGYNGSCKFIVKDYCDCLPEKYDTIVAIESLKHADDLEAALLNLSLALADNGNLIVVEDLLKRNSSKLPHRQLLQKTWALKQLHTKEDYVEQLKVAGMVCIEDNDFTQAVRSRPVYINFLLIAIFGFLKTIALTRSQRRLIAIFQAGFVHELYYATGRMEYRAMVFRRRPSGWI